MPTVIVDARCLQDAGYVDRGVGRHVMALLRGAPPQVTMIGLVDPLMAPLLPGAAALMRQLVPNAYAALAQAPDAFVSLSPMTHDPLFAGALLTRAGLLRAAVVYDFIPHRNPARYLPTPAARLGYASALAWLRRCDLFAPISQSAADDAVAVLNVPPGAIAVTGAPLDAHFIAALERQGPGGPRHLLVVAGPEGRKNPELVIRAHALSAALQAQGVPLVVAGQYSPADVAAFAAVAAAAGGRADLLHVPCRVPDERLVELYTQAIAVICPSRDEGFSIPVVEAMAAGVLSLASDIPAHRELVVDPALRFDPDEPAALTPLLEQAVIDPRWRQDRAAAQAVVWPRFRAERVAGRFWDALLARLPVPAGPAILRGARPRVALLSPMPPDRSGVADYTAATCGPLSQLVDLQVFTATERPTPVPGTPGLAPLSALPHLLPTYDRVVNVIGNSNFHLSIFESLLRYGGASITHDARMLGFYRIMLGEDRALATAASELGRPVDSAEMNRWLADEGTLEAMFLGDIAAQATPTIFHSRVTADLFRARYRVEPVYIPFSIYRPWSAADLSAQARAAARARLGLDADEIAIATFGFVHSSKAPESCLWALDLLRGWGLNASLHFVGSIDSTPDSAASLQALAADLGMAGKVRFLGSYVPEQAYRDYLAGSDLGIQLRTYGMGGLSGGLLDCAAVGLPTVANQALFDAVEAPDSYTGRIPNGISPVLLAEELARLWEAGPAPARREADRQAFSEDRSFTAYSKRLLEALGLQPGRPR